MKKFFAIMVGLLLIVGMSSCNSCSKAEEEVAVEAVDSTATAVDSTAAETVVDSTAVNEEAAL